MLTPDEIRALELAVEAEEAEAEAIRERVAELDAAIAARRAEVGRARDAAATPGSQVVMAALAGMAAAIASVVAWVSTYHFWCQ